MQDVVESPAVILTKYAICNSGSQERGSRKSVFETAPAVLATTDADCANLRLSYRLTRFQAVHGSRKGSPMNRLRTISLARSSRLTTLPASLLLILASIPTPNVSVHAQSGRRASGSTQRTATPEAVNSTTVELRARSDNPRHELKRKVTLLLATDLTKRHLPAEDTIYASLIKRLNEFTNVSGTAIGELNRDQVIKRAKAEIESFVVLLQFDIDNVQNGKPVINSGDLEVKYFVFAPRTGEQQLKGKLYYQAIGGAHGRKDTWPAGPPIKITGEASGIEVAERLYAWLSVAIGTNEK